MASRLETKANECIANKEYYEAHQIYRTMYYRMSGAGKFDDLKKILFDGAMQMFAVNEYQSATDLADLYINVLVKSDTPATDEIFLNIEKILIVMCSDNGNSDESSSKTRVESRNKFVADSVRWSQAQATKRREKKRGMSALHLRIGQILWDNKIYEGARSHLLVSEKPEVFAEFLVDMHTQLGDPEESDMFIALAALQLLCLHRVTTASRLIPLYINAHPALNHNHAPPYDRPLLNFIWLLCIAAHKRKATQFAILVEKYQPSLARDCNYKGYLDKIGQLFFGLPPPASAGGGILGGMLKGLLGENKPEEKEEFSDSDMESDDTLDIEGKLVFDDIVDGDDDGFMTADDEEQETPPLSSRSAVPARTVPQMRMPVLAPKPTAVSQMNEEDLD